MSSYDEVLAVILGGGRGSRLYPLTRLRSKPAVPIAGKYRLIDIPLSNCINSGLYRIAVLTQFNSVSLHRHISSTYQFDVFHAGWVQILAAEQTPDSADWYQGTADAVRKQLFEIHVSGARYVLILAGDHLYRMDYRELIRRHWESGADVTVAVQPVAREDASRFGLLRQDEDGRITRFAEKPKDPAVQEQFVCRDSATHPFIGSMGIYLFNIEVLDYFLREHPAYDDFGSDVIPHAIRTHHVQGFEFTGYWRDIGTIRSFYETNLELTRPDTPFDFYDPQAPIYTHARFLPGSQIHACRLDNVFLAEGCRLDRADIQRAVIGIRTVVQQDAVIRDSIIMGADYYTTRDGHHPQIGAGSSISGAIIDKNAYIGEGVVIRPFPREVELAAEHWVIRDGIVVIPKGAHIPAGTRIVPESFDLEVP